MIREAELARTHRRAAPADERDHRRAVVRRSERRVRRRARRAAAATPAAECTIVTSSASLEVERRQEAREPRREHRLARPGRAHHQEVMRRPRPRPRPRGDRARARARRGGRARARELVAGAAPEGRATALARAAPARARASVARDPNLTAVRHTGFGRTVGRHDEPTARHHRGEGHHAGHPPKAAVEPELGEERETLDRGRLELAVGHEHPDRDRQVEPRATFAETRRGQVDCDPLQRPPEAAGHDRTPDPVSRLTTGGIG